MEKECRTVPASLKRMQSASEGWNYEAVKQLRIQKGEKFSKEYRAEVATICDLGPRPEHKEVRINGVEAEDVPTDSNTFTLVEGDQRFGPETGWRLKSLWDRTSSVDLWLET